MPENQYEPESSASTSDSSSELGQTGVSVKYHNHRVSPDFLRIRAQKEKETQSFWHVGDPACQSQCWCNWGKGTFSPTAGRATYLIGERVSWADTAMSYGIAAAYYMSYEYRCQQ